MAEWLYMVPLVSMLLVYLSECSLEFVEECSLKGFTPNLLCSTCDLMEDFKLGAIKPDCMQCCQKDQTEQTGPTHL